MSSAKITLLGQYNYDNTLFDGLTFPAGINKQTAVDEILLKAADFEVLYSDIEFNKQAITHWGVKNFRTFEQWVKALAIEFDPLYNFDRFEEYTDEKLSQGNTKNVSSNEAVNNEVVNNSESSNNFESSNNSENTNNSEVSNNSQNNTNHDSGKSVSQTNTDSHSTDTDTRSVSAYDSATYQPREQEVKDNISGQTGNGVAVNENDSNSESRSTAVNNSESKRNTETESISNNVNNSNNVRNANSIENGTNDTTSNNTEQIKHTSHLYGNIGVTTSTQLLEDFLRVERFNIYEQLADMFISELCLLIY